MWTQLSHFQQYLPKRYQNWLLCFITTGSKQLKFPCTLSDLDVRSLSDLTEDTFLKNEKWDSFNQVYTDLWTHHIFSEGWFSLLSVSVNSSSLAYNPHTPPPTFFFSKWLSELNFFAVLCSLAWQINGVDLDFGWFCSGSLCFILWQ